MESINDLNLTFVYGGSKIPYIVQKGDTLSELAQKFNCSVEDICKWNNIENPNKIEIGQKIIFKF